MVESVRTDGSAWGFFCVVVNLLKKSIVNKIGEEKGEERGMGFFIRLYVKNTNFLLQEVGIFGVFLLENGVVKDGVT
jgi:hypothetical protein